MISMQKASATPVFGWRVLGWVETQKGFSYRYEDVARRERNQGDLDRQSSARLSSSFLHSVDPLGHPGKGPELSQLIIALNEELKRLAYRSS